MAAGEPEVLHGRSALFRPSRPDRPRRPALPRLRPRGTRTRASASVAARMQRAERFAHLAVLEAAMHRDQRVGRMIAERCRRTRPPPPRRRAPPRCRARRNARRAAAPAVRPPRRDPPRSPRRSAPASTSRATRCREMRRGTPSAPCLRASPRPRSRTRTRPTPPIRRARRRARTRTCRTDRAGWCAAVSRARPARVRIEPGRRAERGISFLRSTSTLPMRRTSRSPFSSMSRRTPLSRGRRCRYSFATAREAVLLPGVDVHHQVAREALDQRARRRDR